MAQDTSKSDKGISRRGFLSKAAVGGVAAAATPLLLHREASARPQHDPEGVRPRRWGGGRALAAFGKRYDAAAAYLRSRSLDQPTNGDERRYADYRASFFKTLPQNEYGEVDRAAFRKLRRALERGSFRALERVPLSHQAARGLANPLASFAFEMVGPDAWATRMAPCPRFDGPVIAAEMAEVWWQALTRDVPFRHYDTDPDVAAAVADLNAFRHRLGSEPTIRPGTLFRGETPGDLVGPYVSQLLWLPARWGLVELDQKLRFPRAGEDFCLLRSDWLAVQRGAAPSVSTAFDPTPRHISNGRDLAEYVHNDVVYQAYLTAALILLGFGSDALDRENPYLAGENQGGFVTFGAAEIVDLVAKVAHAALKAAWFHKWQAHRRLRPEVFAARAEFQSTGERSYGIDEELLGSAAAAELQSRNGSLLLPLAYPEGSPTHPAYPAGHAAVAGACCTVLKAFFDESYEIPDPVIASADGSRLDPWTGAPLTVGGEIDKLANNISLGRDTAGVHYRSDGVDGIKLGEDVALGVLRDYAATRRERFAGFGLTRFDGTPIRVGGDGTSRRRVHRRRRLFHRGRES